MKTQLVTTAALLALIGLFAGPAGASDPQPGIQQGQPPGDTIVHVEGDKANGFGVYYYDGSAIFPPTDSEARAECGEYDTRVARVRCRTEVRVWYRDLADLQQALNHAHSG